MFNVTCGCLCATERRTRLECKNVMGASRKEEEGRLSETGGGGVVGHGDASRVGPVGCRQEGVDLHKPLDPIKRSVWSLFALLGCRIRPERRLFGSQLDNP